MTNTIREATMFIHVLPLLPSCWGRGRIAHGL